MNPPTSQARVRLFEIDPDLLALVDRQDASSLRRNVTTRVEIIPCGYWLPDDQLPDAAHFGFLVLSGGVVRKTPVAGRLGTDLLGTGDILQPWREEPSSLDRVRANWHVFLTLELAALDQEFLLTIARWPGIVSELAGRFLRRSRYAELRLGIVNRRNVATRVHLLLWHMADRWGTRAADGVLLPIDLPQETLGDLVCATRPRVNGALQQLQAEGLLSRRAEGWVLHGDPPAEPSAGSPRIHLS